MNKIIGVTELQRNFRAVFDEVVRERMSYVLTRGSRPEAVLIPYEQYVKYFQSPEEDIHARFDALLARMEELNARFSDEEIERDLEEVSRARRTRKLREQTPSYRRSKKQTSASRKKT